MSGAQTFSRRAQGGDLFVYEDHHDDYVTSEPAPDCTVASLFLLATVGGGG